MVGDRVLRNELFNFSLEQAKELGNLALNYHGKSKKELGVKIKTGFEDDPVTVADLAVDKQLHKNFNDFFHNKAIILSEETEFQYSKKEILSLKKPILIADPIDGSVNFMNGKEDFSILFAIAEYIGNKYEITGSVVYKPKTNELWFSTINNDAIYEKDNVKINLITNQNSVFKQGVTPINLIGSENKFPQNYDTNLRELTRFYDFLRMFNPQSLDLERFSGGLEMIDVAMGRTDAYAVTKCANWDYMGPMLIVNQAGGNAYRINSIDDFINPKKLELDLDNPQQYFSAFFTNGKMDNEIFAYIRENVEQWKYLMKDENKLNQKIDQFYLQMKKNERIDLKLYSNMFTRIENGNLWQNHK